MEEYASNSHKSKVSATQVASSKKVVNKVVTNAATVKKKNEIQKFTDVFISEDVENVKEYIVGDVLIPAIKKTISDIVKTGIDMLMYGETRPQSSKNQSRVQYQNYWDRQNRVDDRNRSSNGISRTGLNYNNITYSTLGDAVAVLNELDALIQEYGVASIADLYSASNVPYTNYMYNEYGWKNLDNAKTYPVSDGYMIRLPKAIPL